MATSQYMPQPGLSLIPRPCRASCPQVHNAPTHGCLCTHSDPPLPLPMHPSTHLTHQPHPPTPPTIESPVGRLACVVPRGPAGPPHHPPLQPQRLWEGPVPRHAVPGWGTWRWWCRRLRRARAYHGIPRHGMARAYGLQNGKGESRRRRATRRQHCTGSVTAMCRAAGCRKAVCTPSTTALRIATTQQATQHGICPATGASDTFGPTEVGISLTGPLLTAALLLAASAHLFPRAPYATPRRPTPAPATQVRPEAAPP